MARQKAKSQDEILNAWRDEIVRLSDKKLYATVPPRIFEELKSLHLVEGSHDACRASGNAYKQIIERRNGAKSNKKSRRHN